MTLQLTPEKTIGAVQDEFSAYYPGLRLGFFTKAHDAHAGSTAKSMLQDRNLTLAALSPNLKEDHLEIRPDITVWTLEQQFEQRYGLHVQLFRHSGTLWLETSATDDLTLTEQMARAKASQHPRQSTDEPMDYREQD